MALTLSQLIREPLPETNKPKARKKLVRTNKVK